MNYLIYSKKSRDKFIKALKDNKKLSSYKLKEDEDNDMKYFIKYMKSLSSRMRLIILKNINS